MRALVLVLLLGQVGCKAREEAAPPPGPPPPKKDPAIEARRKTAVERQRTMAAIEETDFAGPPCDVSPPTVPMELGGMQLQWTGDLPAGGPGADTHGYLLRYWRFTGSQFDVVAREGLETPFQHEPFPEVAATVIIDRYLDPYFSSETRYSPGELEGRVLLWHDGALACGAKVNVKNAQVTVVNATGADYRTSREDPLSKARIDLVNEALRAGLPALRKPSAAQPDCAHAPPAKVAPIDLRGVPAPKIAGAAFLDEVGKQLAKEPPSHRIWLFSGHTFDPWQKDSYEAEIGRWKEFLESHPAKKDEIVVDRRLDTNGVLVERLTDAGLPERRPARLCEAGAERDIVQLARPAPGVQIRTVATR